ncbi:unnamed protein product [Phytophthora lilii]|uniref:Unnamed protein product n=1 Tax=Phytophthora lilii TaxID=2077276 RepID=A0A9W6TPU1_9STRA|nr:unnamed protein product [Phytophthora lilii]
MTPQAKSASLFRSAKAGARKATSVLWERIPQLAVVAFFQDIDCSGEVMFTTDPSRSSGSHPFNVGPIGKIIRSLMVLEYSEHSVGGIINECFPDLDKLLESTNATNTTDSNCTKSEATVVFIPQLEGNTSSNWKDPLPACSTSVVCVFYFDGVCKNPVFITPPLDTTGFFLMETEGTPDGVNIESLKVITYAKYL